MKKPLFANPILYTILAVISFIVSGAVTVALFISTSSGILGTLLMFLTAMVFELSKCALLYQAFKGSFNIGIRITFGCLWFAVTIASIVASAGFVISQERETKNIAIESSTEYNQQEENRKLKNDELTIKKQELAQLQANKSKIISDMEKIRDSWNRDCITMKGNEQAKINAKDKELTEAINAKSNEISDKTNELSTPPTEIKPQLQDTNGYSAIFELLANSLNKNNPRAKKDPYKPEVLQMWFFILLGVGLEILGNTFIFLSQHYSASSVVSVASNQNSKVVGFNKTPVTATAPEQITYQSPECLYTPDFYNTSGRQIGFQYSTAPDLSPTLSTSGYTKEDIQAYIEFMYSSPKYLNQGESPGYNPIGNETGIGVENARKIKSHLERLGIVKSVGTKTFVLMDYQACCQKVQA